MAVREKFEEKTRQAAAVSVFFTLSEQRHWKIRKLIENGLQFSSTKGKLDFHYKVLRNLRSQVQGFNPALYEFFPKAVFPNTFSWMFFPVKLGVRLANIFLEIID